MKRGLVMKRLEPSRPSGPTIWAVAPDDLRRLAIFKGWTDYRK
jgi:hypothetical protein